MMLALQECRLHFNNNNNNNNNYTHEDNFTSLIVPNTSEHVHDNKALCARSFLISR